MLRKYPLLFLERVVNVLKQSYYVDWFLTKQLQKFYTNTVAGQA